MTDAVGSTARIAAVGIESLAGWGKRADITSIIYSEDLLDIEARTMPTESDESKRLGCDAPFDDPIPHDERHPSHELSAGGCVGCGALSFMPELRKPCPDWRGEAKARKQNREKIDKRLADDAE